ncbi:MAG: hypothetical protein ACKV2U_19905 [Bryobacteraceae bacterium]
MPLRLFLTALLLAAAGCSRQRASVAVDAALLIQVPADSIALGAMRVKALRQTAAWKRLLEQPGVNAQLEKLAAETSFDARKDLWEILWSTDGKETLVYARGEFAPLGLEPKIEREGAQRMNYKGSMLLGNEENAVWFVNSSTAIFGHTAKIRSMIDSRDAGKVGPAAALRERIDAFPPNSHFWFVADAKALPKLPEADDAPASALAMNFMQNLPKLMQAVRMVAMHASLVDGMAVETTAFCDSEAGARQVHDSLRGIVGIARIGLPEKQRTMLLPLLDAVEVAQRQTEASLRARLTVQQFENMQALLLPGPTPGKAMD